MIYTIFDISVNIDRRGSESHPHECLYIIFLTLTIYTFRYWWWLKQRLYFNRPIYVGFTILDMSKTPCTTFTTTTLRKSMDNVLSCCSVLQHLHRKYI